MAKITWKLAEGMTWRKKLEQEHPNHGKTVPVPERFRKRYGKGRMLIPRPLDVDAIMRKVPKGKLITSSQLRERLAKDAKVAAACPLTTGIFMRVAAEAAEEDRKAGKKRVTPYWRTIKDNGQLNEKYPGGAKAHAAKLRAEGFSIERGTGKSAGRVKDFEAYLVK